ncbi:hypothetical protein MCOR30_005391 [Pyricularia oryzae]|nr:hypothetical protein MCOR30_005391 [Pyricularia oryzae]
MGGESNPPPMFSLILQLWHGPMTYHTVRWGKFRFQVRYLAFFSLRIMIPGLKSKESHLGHLNLKFRVGRLLGGKQLYITEKARHLGDTQLWKQEFAYLLPRATSPKGISLYDQTVSLNHQSMGVLEAAGRGPETGLVGTKVGSVLHYVRSISPFQYTHPKDCVVIKCGYFVGFSYRNTWQTPVRRSKIGSVWGLLRPKNFRPGEVRLQGPRWRLKIIHASELLPMLPCSRTRSHDPC